MGINSISPRQFKKHIQFLVDQGYETHTFANLQSNTIPSKPVIITFDDGYECVYKHAYPILRQAGFKAVVFVVAGYINDWNRWDTNLGKIRFRHLSADQIRGLSQAGWEIGSHSVNHRPLPYLNNNLLHSELTRSSQILKHITDKDIVSISYPFGIQNPRVQATAKKVGYRYACQNISWNGKKRNVFAIPRLPVYQFDTAGSLQKKLSIPTNISEKIKLSLFNFPSRFTPIYQILFRRYLFLEK